MEIQELVEKYFEQIKIEYTDFVPVDDAISDAAYLVLDLPIEMLRDYQQFKCGKNKLPDGAEFWKETGMVKRLRDSGKHSGQGHAPLMDVLDCLNGKVWVAYRNSNNSNRKKMSITEVPDFHSE